MDGENVDQSQEIIDRDLGLVITNDPKVKDDGKQKDIGLEVEIEKGRGEVVVAQIWMLNPLSAK